MSKQLFTMDDKQSDYMFGQMASARNQRVMYASGGVPLFDDPQEIANRAWKKLADGICLGYRERRASRQEFLCRTIR